jgi:hypothetical protein
MTTHQPFPEGLETVDKELFDRVWRVVEECGEAERHFNQLQSVYRGVASTWLLATFAGVGYLLYDKDGKVSHPGIAALICLAGFVGILLIWVLDLDVYHRLLVAVFREGLAVENYYTWLPKYRRNMHSVGRNANSSDPIRRRLAFYYVGTELGTFGAGTFCAIVFLINKGFPPFYCGVVALFVGGAVLTGWNLFRKTAKT